MPGATQRAGASSHGGCTQGMPRAAAHMISVGGDGMTLWIGKVPLGKVPRINPLAHPYGMVSRSVLRNSSAVARIGTPKKRAAA